MKDMRKTKAQLVNELAKMRRRITRLEKSEAKRKQAEKALRESEERFRETVELLPTVICEIGLDGRISYVNRVGLELFGYSQDDFEAGVNVMDTVHPVDRERAAERIQKIMQGEKLGPSEYQMLKKDGSEFFCLVDSFPVYRNGKPVGLRTSLTDVTERKRAEEQTLRKSVLLEAINKVFRETLTCENEEDVARTCLAVAEELTDSKFGFIGEVNQAGRFDCIAISDPGWDTCKMPKSDAVVMLKDMEIRGIWGRVFKDEQSQVINDPTSHPDRVGTPEGHPPITSFLGVPLKHAGKTVGIIGLANKESGYDPADQDAVETLSVAFLEAMSRKRAEEALKQSEERYRFLYEESPSINMIIGLDGTIKDINKSLTEKLGYAKEDLIGKPALEFVAPEQIEKVAAQMERDFMGEETPEIDVDCHAKDGSIHTIFFSPGQVLLYEGEQPTSILVTGVDITDRKEAERALASEKERLAVTLRSIGDAVITTDTEGKVLLINKVAEKLTGWGEEEAVGKPLHEVFHIIDEKTRERCEKPVDKVMEAGVVVGLANQTVLISRDGTERIIADSGAPIHDVESNILGVVLVFRDITEVRKMEEELRKAQRLESLGILAGGIAHDFNNILTTMLGNITLAKTRAEPGDRIFDRMEEAESAALRAKDLTHQLLTFSRGGAPVKKIASVGELIEESVSFALLGSNVWCEFSIPDDLWQVEVDQSQISQVINNLVINADQAMPGGGTIQVEAENVTLEPGHPLPLREGRYVKISVADHGVGISEEHLPKIFDPFYTTKQKGSGLGLAICHSILKRHEGLITAESELEAGTTLHVYLPASEKETPSKEVREAKSIAGEGRILVMDDEEAVRKIAGVILTDVGYEVDFAKDGAEAIDLYRRARESGKPFDAVILDLTVRGGMGGKDAVKKLIEMDAQVKAIASTGYSTDPIMADYKSYGFRGAIAKPYTIEELSKIVYEVVMDKEDTNGR